MCPTPVRNSSFAVSQATNTFYLELRIEELKTEDSELHYDTLQRRGLRALRSDHNRDVSLWPGMIQPLVFDLAGETAISGT